MRHLMVMAFLMGISGRLSASLNSLIQHKDLATGQVDPEITLNPVDLYIKKDITGASNIVNLIDANTLKQKGVVSFDSNGRLYQNRAVIFDKIFVGYQTNAAANMEGQLVYNAVPTGALYNADLIIRQDGREVVRKNVSSLINLGQPLSLEEYYADLGNLRYLKDNEEVEIDLEFANGASMPLAATAYQYIFVKISGFETQRKEKK